MSLDDSNTPAPQGAETDPSTRRGGLAGNVPLLVGLALLLVIGAIGFFVFGGGGDDSEARGCISEEVTLTTAPVMEPLVKTAIKSIQADEPCIDVVVSSGTVKDVVATLSDPNVEMPEIWIPDSPTWKGQLTAAGWTGTPIGDVLAQTPVGLVGGPASKAPLSWGAALDGGRLAMADPSADGASALALLAPFAESKQTGATLEQIQQKIPPVAQTFGERAVSGSSASTDLSTISASSTQLVPATEQGYLSARRSNDQLALVVPKTGVPMLQYPIVGVTRGSAASLGSDRDLAGRVGRAVARWFTSAEGREAVAAAELRGPDGAALADGIGMGGAKSLAKVDQKTTDDTLRQWRVLSVPSSILAVVDLSGSMKTAIGDTTRIQLAASAAGLALDALPDHARIGSWGFSKNRGGEGQSWAELSPLRRLDAAGDEGLDSRESLRKVITTLPAQVRGGTGVMDTVLASYKEAQAKWDPAYFNSVVIFTDGAADDSSSLSLDSLLKQLKNLNDPTKPVRVVIIGISQDADSPELAQIATATGGQNYLVTDPDEILGVLAQALLDR